MPLHFCSHFPFLNQGECKVKMLPSHDSGHVAKLFPILLMRILKIFFKKNWLGIPLFQRFTFIISIFIIFTMLFSFPVISSAFPWCHRSSSFLSCFSQFQFLMLSFSLIMKCTNRELQRGGCSSYTQHHGGQTFEGWSVQWGALWHRWSCKSRWKSRR